MDPLIEFHYAWHCVFTLWKYTEILHNSLGGGSALNMGFVDKLPMTSHNIFEHSLSKDYDHLCIYLLL